MRSETELPVNFAEWEIFQWVYHSLPVSRLRHSVCNWPSLSSKWPRTKSYTHSLFQVRFDINALSPNNQISRSCCDRQSLNSSCERRYCNNSQFEFPSWIDKSLFGAKAVVLRSPSLAVLATLWTKSIVFEFDRPSLIRVSKCYFKISERRGNVGLLSTTPSHCTLTADSVRWLSQSDYSINLH